MSPADPPPGDDEPAKTPFLPILGYVLGFMALMGLLALLFVWLARVL